MQKPKTVELDSLIIELGSYKTKDDWEIDDFETLRNKISNILSEPAKNKFDKLEFYTEIKEVDDYDELPF